MRVLFTTFAATSHVNTQVPLAWALRVAGHEVCLASQPDVTEYITHTGLTAVPVGAPLHLDEQMAGVNQPRGATGKVDVETLDVMALTDMSGLHPERLTYDYLQTTFTVMQLCVYRTLSADAMIDDLVDFARSWRPDLVIWDTTTFAGPVCAMATGAAHARQLFGFDLLASARATYRDLLNGRPPELADDPMEEWLGPILGRYGCEFSEEAVVGQWTIDPIPSSMRLPVDHHYVPVRYVPYNGPATIPEWLREPPERRRICLTLGVSSREVVGADRASVDALLEAVADLDVEVVATLNADQLAALPHVPDNVRTVDFVPLDALLPSCSAIIHHGGSGSLQTAQTHGVPQIIVPDMIWDCEHKMRALEESGAGLCARDVDQLTAGELRTMLVRVLDEPSFAENAALVRQEMLGTPAPRDIVPVLEKLTAEYRKSGFPVTRYEIAPHSNSAKNDP